MLYHFMTVPLLNGEQGEASVADDANLVRLASLILFHSLLAPVPLRWEW